MVTAFNSVGDTLSEHSNASFLDAAGPDRPKSSTPNVVVVLLDDVGFAQLGAFGSEINTPHIDALAANGLSYNRFHVTSICSSSRAALMTGRNHHAVGMGGVADGATTAAGYTSRLPQSAATMQRLLRDSGYNTFAVGKWHLTPNGERSHAGPFTQWPLGTGFEQYYGFLRADANQWTPNLTRDNHPVDPPKTPEEGYHLTEDMADQAITYLLDQKQVAPEKPFYLYFTPGAMHAPHHVAPEWVEPYRGKFDDGWEAMRERIFAKQVEAGVIPEGTTLTERPSWIPDWETLDDEDRALYARMHEVYAGFMTHTDAQVGRLVEFLREMGELDNTLFIVTSDNGASAEGGEIGAINEHHFTQRLPESREANLAGFDDWGGFRGYHHYAWGWAWAGNTPLRLWKRYAWLGGTRTPMVVHWPDGIAAKGEIRSQFCHIVDLMPTILDVCGVGVPNAVDGVTQQPMDGSSIASTFDDAAAPNPRSLQYFEMMGSRGIFSGEWKATTNHIMPLLLDEARLLEGSRDYVEDQWHLFDLSNDFAETNDVAAENPDVLDRLKGEWHAEAERNNVFPLLGGWDPREGEHDRHQRQPGITMHPRRVFRPGGHPITDEALPPLVDGGEMILTVDPGTDRSGVLCAIGDWTQGWALYIDEGLLTFVFNSAGEPTHVTADRVLNDSSTALGFRLTPDADGVFTAELLEDGDVIGSGVLERGVPLTMLQVGGTGLCLGYDRGFPVTDRYEVPFRFTGTLHYAEIEVPEGAAVDPLERMAQALHED